MAGRFVLDLRYALRTLRRSPAFSFVAVLVLSLGVGVNTAVFGLVDALLFKPLPVRDPSELVRVATNSGADGAVSYADFLDYGAEARTLSGLAAFTADALELRTDSAPVGESVAAYLVSDNYFEVIGVEGLRGRSLGAAAATGETHGVVLGDSYWRTRFGADPRVLGRGLWLNRESYTVVGVAPAGFTGTQRGGAPDLFVPLAIHASRTELMARGRRAYIAVGRLAPSASPEAAQAELSAIAARLAAAHPESNFGVKVAVGPERTAPFREVPQLVYVVGAVYATFGLLLTLACVNLAGLLTARAALRRREIAVRATLGASRRALVAQLLTESLVLAVFGGVGGLLVGLAARRLLWTKLQTAVAEHLGHPALWIDTQADGRTILFVFAATALATLAFGLLPALHASRHDLYGRTKDDPWSPAPAQLARLRRLVGAQVAVSSVLLAGAGLLLQTVRNASSADLGYPLEGVSVVDLSLPGLEPRRAQPAFDQALRRVKAVPGVVAAALGGGGWPAYLPSSVTPGRPRQNYVRALAGPGYFGTLRIPLVAGREFDERDERDSAPVVIMNRKLADALWPGQDPVGRRLTLNDREPPATVVGVAQTVRTFPVGPPFFMIYTPFAQAEATSATLSVRTAPGHEDRLPRLVSQEIRGLPAGFSHVRVRPLEDAVATLLVVPRSVVAVLGALGAVALLLASVGLYGVTAYVAGRRARECAVRRVLGASLASVFRLLAASALRPVAVGLGTGAALSLAAGLLFKSAVLGPAFDPLALVAAPVVLAAAAFTAVAIPVFRAARLELMAVLREE